MAVITGKHRGATAKVTDVLVAENRVVLEGLNLAKRHRRATRGGEKGRVIERAMPIHASNVMPVDPKTGKPTRVGVKQDGAEKTRVAKRSGQTL